MIISLMTCVNCYNEVKEKKHLEILTNITGQSVGIPKKIQATKIDGRNSGRIIYIYKITCPSRNNFEHIVHTHNYIKTYHRISITI